MKFLSLDQRIAVVKALVEGKALRETARMVGVARMTVGKLLGQLSRACMDYQDTHLRNLKCVRIRCSATWSFVCRQPANVCVDAKEESGAIWTWVGIDEDSKLALSWLVGDRSAASAFTLIDDLASRLSHGLRLVANGNSLYLDAVEQRFGASVDYSTLTRIYGSVHNNKGTLGTRVESYGRFVAVHFMHHNFVRIRETLHATPAMVAGISQKAWQVEDMVALLQ